MKQWVAACLVAAFLWAALGVAARAGDRLVVTIGVSRTPSALPVLRLVESGALADAADVRLAVWTAPEQLIAMAQDGAHQMFTLPLTIAATLSNKGVDVRLTNVNTWGALYFVTSDPGLESWEGLRGKTIYVPQRHSPPDALTQYFLRRAGLEPGRDVDIVHSTISEIAQLLKAGRIAYATLLEPQATAATMGGPPLRAAFDFAAEWKKIRGADSDLPSLGFGGGADFIAGNRAFVVRFEDAYREAVDWVAAHPAEAGQLAEKHLGIKAGVVAAAMSTLGLRYVTATDAKRDVGGFFQVLYDFSPSMIGGRIPDETLYWK